MAKATISNDLIRLVLAAVLAAFLFILVVPTICFLMMIILGPLIGYVAALIITILFVLAGCVVYVLMVRKMLRYSKQEYTKKENRFYIVLNVSLVISLILLYIFFAFYGDLGISFPTSRHLYDYDICAITNSAGYIPETKAWICNKPNGQQIVK